MARIVGVDLPKDKRVEIGLTYIYGIGRVLALDILDEAGVDIGKKIKDLTEEEIGRIASIMTNNYKVEGDLRRDVTQNIKRLVEIGSYRGLRHRKSLPCRGQRTKTNSRTRRGKRRTIGSKGKA